MLPSNRLPLYCCGTILLFYVVLIYLDSERSIIYIVIKNTPIGITTAIHNIGLLLEPN